MIPIKFEEHNRVLGAPQGQEENVKPLHIFTNEVECISCWEVDEDELAEINKTKQVYLRCFTGITQPPVALFGKSPFKENYRTEQTQQLIYDMIAGEVECDYFLASNLVKYVNVSEEEFEYIMGAVKPANTADEREALNDYNTLVVRSKQHGLICFRKL